MKLINIKSLIRRGILRIFPLPISFEKAVIALCLITTACILIGCSSTRQMTTQLIHDVHTDTIFLSSKQYDSIYIYQDRSSEYHRARPELVEGNRLLRACSPEHLRERKNYFNQSSPSPDTLFIKDVSIEYRYKFLRDTVRLIERDSIPYEVTITEVKEITRPLTAYDKACRITSWFVIGFLLSFIIFKFKFNIRL